MDDESYIELEDNSNRRIFVVRPSKCTCRYQVSKKKSKLSELEERITARKKRTLSLLTSIECNPTAIKSNVEQQASQRKKYGSTNDHDKDIKASGSTTRKRTQTFGGQYDNDKDENNGKRESMEERIKRKSYYCRVGSGGHKQQHHQKSITSNRSNGIKADNDTTIGKESKNDETTKTEGKPTVSSG